MDGEILRRLQGQSVEKVVRRLFRPHPKAIDAVGFKYFYYHPVDGDSNAAWEEIDKRGCRVLHLRRENILRTEVSRLIANKVGVWSRRRGREASLEMRRVTVQPAAVLRALEKTRSWERAARERWDGGAYAEVSYEELTSDPGPTLARIHDFLGVPYRPTDSPLKRQNPEPIRDLVANFEELRAELEKTEWKHLLQIENEVGDSSR
jgi:LPS sulfotransferase NodH